MKKLIVVAFGFSFFAYTIASNCGNTLPVVDYFRYGYDMSQFDFYGCPDIGGKRAKIAEFDKCDKGKKYKSPFEPRIEYDVPDGFSDVYYAGSSAVNTGHVYHSLEEFIEDHVRDRISRRRQIEGIGKSMFKNSKFYKLMQRWFANKASVPSSYQTTSFLHASTDLFMYNFTTPEFKNEIQSLPQYFNGSEKVYLDFVRKYGTHYIEIGHFGGIINRMKVIPLNETGKEAEINWEMRKDFPKFNDTVKVTCEKKDGPFRVQLVHSEDRDFVQLMIGGWADYTLYRGNDYADKLAGLPVLITAEIKPISALIEDYDENKERNIVAAIKVYMARAYLDSVVATVKLLLDSVSDFPSEISDLLNRYEQSRLTYNTDELMQLAGDFNREAKSF